MKSIKVAIYGWDGFTCQIPRIKEGMQTLGHILSQDSPDLIYCNDPIEFQKAIDLKKKYPKAFLILNILDIPWHFTNINKIIEIWKNFLIQADAVTTISLKVKKDLSQLLDKKIYVIYNPIKDVYYDENVKKNNMFLYVGRANDPIKRIGLVRESLTKIPDGLKSIKICGSENPGFGNYLGVVSDQELNKLYNSSKYVYLPSKAEGIGLTMIEAMICGAVPITCSDNLTAKEFSPKNFICEPKPQCIADKINEINKEYKINRNLSLEYGKRYKVQFDKKNIAENIINIFNSK
tara:strand:- start:55 stop:930 length:876 start_codon:yes stop_codon:yes gene_type:complete